MDFNFMLPRVGAAQWAMRGRDDRPAGRPCVP